MTTPVVTDEEITTALHGVAQAWTDFLDTLERAGAVQRAVVFSACPLSALSRRDLMLTLHAWAGVAESELQRAAVLLDMTG